MKNLLKPIIALLCAAVILCGASFGLKKVAEKNAQDEHLKLMQTLLPGSKEFTVEPYTGNDKNIVSVHKAENGFVIETATRGYADEITMLIGVSKEGSVTGLVVLESHETQGLGSKALTDHKFLSQFLNGDGTFTIGKAADSFSGATGTTETTGEEIAVDGISGATVTSKAVARCVNSAIAYVTGADADSSATEWGG